MPNEQEAKQKLRLLASRVKRAPVTLHESARLDKELETITLVNSKEVKHILETTLGKSAEDVNRTLSSHDDSDRLIDEIVRALGK